MTARPAALLPWLAAGAVLLVAAFATDAASLRALGELPPVLRAAAARLTQLGHGAWMATTLLSAMLAAALTAELARAPRLRRRAGRVMRLAVGCFLAVLLAGVAVQILKHAIGRARPELIAEVGAHAFRPLPGSYDWNSFPSGHSTSIAALAMVLSIYLPAARVAWAAMALAVGLTRVVTQHHYLSDVVAGLALGAGVAGLLIAHWRRQGVVPRRPDRAMAAAVAAAMRWLSGRAGGQGARHAAGNRRAPALALPQALAAILGCFLHALAVLWPWRPRGAASARRRARTEGP